MQSHSLSALPSNLFLSGHIRHRRHHSTPVFSPISVTRLFAAVAPPPEVASQGGGDASAEGPIELPPSSSSSIFSTSDDPKPLQVSASVLLTGAISVFLFRSLRRRAKRAKELRVRSSGIKDVKSAKDEALESLKALNISSLGSKAPPSAIQTFLGALAAGAIAVFLYKFTATVEAGLSRQALSDNYSVRQLSITIRTIVTGLCYLATFVFGANSFGLFLYSLQLGFGSLMESDPSNSPAEQRTDSPSDTSMPTGGSTSDNQVDNSNITRKN